MSNRTESTRVYLVRDNSGNFHEMDRKTCGHCKQILQIGESYHEQCYRDFKMRENIMLQERKKQACIDKYGEALSENEIWARENPNRLAAGYSETYNQRLARFEEEKKQAFYKKQAERAERRRQLPNIQYQLEYLKKQILVDEEEEKQEQLKGAS